MKGGYNNVGARSNDGYGISPKYGMHGDVNAQFLARVLFGRRGYGGYGYKGEFLATGGHYVGSEVQRGKGRLGPLGPGGQHDGNIRDDP